MSSERLSNVHRQEILVGSEVIDTNGHVNNVAYVQWMQDVAVGHYRSLDGVTLNEKAGATWVARAHHIEYLQPIFEGDVIEACTWIADMERASSKRCYEFRRGDAVVARGSTDWVFVDSATGRPKRIPEAIRDVVRAAGAAQNS